MWWSQSFSGCAGSVLPRWGVGAHRGGGAALDWVRVMHLHAVAAGHHRGAVAGDCVANVATPRDHLSYENNECW